MISETLWHVRCGIYFWFIVCNLVEIKLVVQELQKLLQNLLPPCYIPQCILYYTYGK